MSRHFISYAALALMNLTACQGPPPPPPPGGPGGATMRPAEPVGEVEMLPDTPPTESVPTGLTLIELPGGAFEMGIDGGADNPTRAVTLSPFAMGETEVTNLQYLEFLDAALAAGEIEVERIAANSPAGSTDDLYVLGSATGRHPGAQYVQLSAVGGTTHAGDPEHAMNRSFIVYDEAIGFDLADATAADLPVNWIKWHGADAFADFFGHRLPTEAEWEYAASAGGVLPYATTDGEISASAANYNGDQPGVYNPDGHVFEVKAQAANPWGLYAMSGNVWEWCSDWYDPDFYSDGSL
ncbi:MAG: sulfatase modifying factor 1, partial [Bradymonadia bacterium]